MSNKRLQKQISFSECERDIYDYLSEQKNASAFVKRLILNHMIENKGKEKTKKPKVKKPKEKPVETPIQEPVEIVEKPTEIVETPIQKPVKIEQNDDENWKLIEGLDL